METHMTQQIKIMLVEDNETYRNAIARTLKRASNIELTSQFSTAEVALRNLQAASNKDHPHLILLDLNLPGMSGLDALPWVKKYAPKVKTMILTQSDAPADILTAISHGTEGYLLKSASADQIEGGIRTVMDGGASLDPSVASFILSKLQNKNRDPESSTDLSNRENEILTLLGQGMEQKEIATHLSISRNTVAHHVKKIYEKLEVTNAPAAIDKAYRTGILPS